VTRSIEEIMAAVNPDAARAALADKRTELQGMIARLAVDYQLERENPSADAEQRTAVLAALERQITTLDWAVQEIDRRLSASAEALLPNRAARRNGMAARGVAR
jgi:hypothetical protein